MNILLTTLGQQVHDAEEESFLLFTRNVPSGNLGFVDARAPSVDIPLHGADYTILQSPTLLSSARAGGTTGAVLWKITPTFAAWISSFSTNPLWTHPASPLQGPNTTVVELGCGISGLVALALGPWVRHYIATDQEYVYRLLRENLNANRDLAYRYRNTGKGGKSGRVGAGAGAGAGQKKRGASLSSAKKGQAESNITFTALDWELDDPGLLKQNAGLLTTLNDQSNNDNEDEEEDNGFDLLLSCDCIYNEALVTPFIRTCADICRLRPPYNPDDEEESSNGNKKLKPTICIIAQQQRSPDVFEAWLEEAMKMFWVWRLGDEVLGEGLRDGTGYVVHLLLLRGDSS